MNMVLIFVTAVSLVIAATVSVLHWRLIRVERRRSAARVEALLDAVSQLPQGSSGQGAFLTQDMPLEPRPSGAAAFTEPGADFYSASLQLTDDRASAPHDLFHEAAQAPSAFGRLLVPVSIGVVVISVILSGILMWTHRRAGDSTSTVTVATAAVNTASSTPLELISLRHQRTGTSLAISGLVRNPATGHVVSGLTVVVLLFDRNGSLATTAKRPLDFRTLAPGDESPFTISLENVGAVGRYRVSFRADDKVVPHVDRRQDAASVAARTHEATEKPYGT